MWTRLDGFDSRPCTDWLVVALLPPGAALSGFGRSAVSTGDSPLSRRFCGAGAPLAGGRPAGSEFSAADEPSVQHNHAVAAAGPPGDPHRGESVRSGSFQGGSACGPSRPNVLG
jgi:hypothetical protein